MSKTVYVRTFSDKATPYIEKGKIYEAVKVSPDDDNSKLYRIKCPISDNPTYHSYILIGEPCYHLAGGMWEVLESPQEKLFNMVSQMFTSGNEIPVERITITRKQFEEVINGKDV